ncbi:hypothetical protein BGZ63DRAFT_415030 [Mariannaea sp. PMI_226]|nr:hypothetical protein BGZ63DRAFT_415030 [Mariannaea sp. PMI_226]
MVNYGRPSKNCLHCRKRKLRCDLRKDGCGQCRRAKLTCIGYRDTTQLVIRDETVSTRHKALIFYQERSVPDPSAQGELYISWDIRARWIFFTQYACFSKTYDQLAPMNTTEPCDGHLEAAVNAVSLAFTVDRLQQNTPSLSRQAAEQYTIAVHKLKRALSSPKTATTDATLQTVILLDLYEKIFTKDNQSPLSWMGHINGALALVAKRGDKNLETIVGRRMTTWLVITLIISCTVANVRIPEALMALSKSLRAITHVALRTPPVALLFADSVNVAADIKEGKELNVLPACRNLDRRLVELEGAFPMDWAPTRIQLSEQTPYGAYYDLYPDHNATQVHNSVRGCRIRVRCLALRHCMQTGQNAEKEIAVIKALSRDICASAIQFVWPDGIINRRKHFTPLQSEQCYTLLCPLYLAGQVCSDPELRAWIVDVMEYISDAGSIKIAREIAGYLKDGATVQFNDVYAMLGGYAFCPAQYWVSTYFP